MSLLVHVFDSLIGEYIDLDSDADLDLEAEKIIKVKIINASKDVGNPDSKIVPKASACSLSPSVNESAKTFNGSISSPSLNDISCCSSSPTSSKINSPSRLENRGSDVPNSRKERSIQDIHRRLITTLTEHIDDKIDEHAFKSLRSLFKLTPKDNKDAYDMSSLLAILERKGLIAPGKYEKLKQALTGIDVTITRDVIEPFEEEIRSISNISEQSNTFHDQTVCRSPGLYSPETVPSYTLNTPGPDYGLNVWITKIARKLNARDLETMKFILRGEDRSPSSVLEKITSPWQLFNHLIDNGKLSRDNILFIQAMLYNAGRITLYKQLMGYGETFKDTLHFYEPSSNQENRDVKFHVSCKKETCEQNLKNIRKIAAIYMVVDIQSVSITRMRGHK
ncbi:Hypothetical predicted protein [Mytilus galloprovincialis]|uniref:DED domain-containing protein n=1 Tax=Mytilus galloprovincialis TaxID=29158 RepID=A0A8B6BHX5_MYTGA|nr:Hypothetical predicted protein [Mytilus galloprovincialis]